MDKFLLIFLLMVSLVAAIDFGYEPRKTYKYNYMFDIQQSKADSDDPNARVTIHMKSSVDFYCKSRDEKNIVFSVKFASVNLAQGDSTTMDPQSLWEYQKALTRYDLQFKLDTETGLASEIMYYDSDYEFAVNLKKGLVTVFQKSTKPADELNEFSVVESDSFGTVETHYSVYEKDGYEVYERKKVNERDTVFSTFESTHFVSQARRIVEKVEFADSNFMPFGDDSGINAGGSGVLSLQQTLEGIPDDVENVNMIKSDLTLEFNNADLFKAQRGTVDVEPILELARKYKESPDDGRLFTQLVDSLMDSDDYVRALKPHLQDGVLKSVLIDALSSTGTDLAIETALEATMKSETGEEFSVKDLDQDQIVRVLMGSSFSNKATRSPVNINQRFIKDSTMPRRVKGAAALSLGNLLYKAGEERVKRERMLRMSLQLLERSLQDSTSEQDMILFLHALGNAGQRSSLPLIMTFAKQGTPEIRKVALYSLRRMKSLSEIHMDLIIISTSDTMADIQLNAFDWLMKDGLTVDEAKMILQELVQRESAIVQNIIALIRSSPLYPPLRDYIDGIVGDKAPLFHRGDEMFIVGTKSMGASVGYDLLFNNPLDTSSGVKANAEAFGTIYAMKKEFSVFDTFARLQGNLVSKLDGVESFVYFSIGGSVWSECVDILGHACDASSPAPPVTGDRKCFDQSKTLVDFSSTVFKETITIPLPYGISLKFGLNIAGILHLDAGAKGCTDPYEGTVTLTPKFGLDVVGDSIIDAILVRAGITVDAQVLHTEVNADVSVDLSKTPREICAHVHVDQKAVTADFEVWAQIRDKLKFCGKMVCGIQWGHGLRAKVAWDGFKRGQYSKDIHKSCAQWRILNPRKPRAMLVIQ